MAAEEGASCAGAGAGIRDTTPARAAISGSVRNRPDVTRRIVLEPSKLLKVARKIGAELARGKGISSSFGASSSRAPQAFSKPSSLPCALQLHANFGFRTPARPAPLWLQGVDEDESDPAGFGSPVDPGVIGALLDQHVAGLEMDFAVVEQHVDLALHDDGIVDGAGAVHERMARRPSPRWRMIGELALHVTGRELLHVRRDRREVDDAKSRAAG